VCTKRNILVVEDDEGVRFILSNVLAALNGGYHIIEAEDGRTALKVCADRTPDLIVTDLMMPNLDGIALTEAIHSHAPGVPVVWITSRGCRNVRRDADRLGVHSCLDKPVRIEDIQRVAREALDTTQGESHEGSPTQGVTVQFQQGGKDERKD
jgi:DNA-binding NtrC family response regulator